MFGASNLENKYRDETLYTYLTLQVYTAWIYSGFRFLEVFG